MTKQPIGTALAKPPWVMCRWYEEAPTFGCDFCRRYIVFSDLSPMTTSTVALLRLRLRQSGQIYSENPESAEFDQV
jgi:hypothetical protein